MTTMKAFVTRHPFAAYVALTLAISWGGFVLAVGPDGIPAAPEAFDRIPLLAIMVMLAGPAVAGVLMTGVVSGRAGLRDLVSRSLKWRVGVRWYAVALLTAPLIFTVTLVPLWLFSPAYRPGIFASDALASFLAMGLVVALVVGVLEEIGWTGFAVPRLRSRYSVLASGLIVGVVWGAWHVLANDVWASVATAGDVPLGPFVVLRGLSLLVGGLLAFRILMVWVYDRTDGSLLVAMLMHASYAASTFILNPLAMSGRSLLIGDLMSALATWLGVAALALGVRGRVGAPIVAFIRRYPVLSFYALVFSVSWGGILILVGPSRIPGTPEQVERLFPFTLLALFAGPSVAGVLMTAIVSGRAGLRDLRSRLLRWRVSGRWYAAALLPGPVLVAAILLGLSLRSSEFMPGIITTEDKFGLLIFGLAWGLIGGGLLEELGWTGFAVPRLRQRYGALTTGLIVGLLWGAWHFLIAFWASRGLAGQGSLANFVVGFLAFYVIALPAYRVLMVWIYDRTDSLLVAMLMHAILSASTLVLQPQATGVHLTWNLVLAVALWVVVAAIIAAGHWPRSQQPLRRRMA